VAGLKVNPNFNDANTLEICPIVFKGINKVDCKYTRNGKTLKYTVDIVNNKPHVNITENTGFEVEIKK
jgi:hypothetical protein